MKLSHLTIFFLIIILPFSIVARNNMNDYFITLEDQVRINNVIDIATQDALDTLVELNEEFQMLYINERFDITQTLAKEAVKSFFKTLAINYNMPYREGYTETYFSMYVPAIVIVAYDGFFIYSVDENSAGGYAYQISPKIPYSYIDGGTGAIVNFTLGNYIKIFTNGKFYEGELTDDYIADSDAKYQEFVDAFGGDEVMTFEYISDLTTDMSIMLAALQREGNRVGTSFVPDFLITISGDATSKGIPLKKDYGQNDEEPSNFHKLRREVILKVIKETLQQEINSHTTYARIMGSTYDFNLPEIANDDWTNSINDISVMSFMQGMPMGTKSYYNNYALGGSRIIQSDYIHGTTDKYYHSIDCPYIQEFLGNEVKAGVTQLTVDNIFINREQAAKTGYYPCSRCRP